MAPLEVRIAKHIIRLQKVKARQVAEQQKRAYYTAPGPSLLSLHSRIIAKQGDIHCLIEEKRKETLIEEDASRTSKTAAHGRCLEEEAEVMRSGLEEELLRREEEEAQRQIEELRREEGEARRQYAELRRHEEEETQKQYEELKRQEVEAQGQFEETRRREEEARRQVEEMKKREENQNSRQSKERGSHGFHP